MDAKLVVVGGKASKGRVSLKLPTVIGRSRDADLTVAHPMVSRQHCELYEVNGLMRIRDLGSLNGTFVRAERVREADLYPNAEFTVGPLTFRVEYDYVGQMAAPPDRQPVEKEDRRPEVAFLEEVSDVRDTEKVSGAEQPPLVSGSDRTSPVEEQLGIAPPSGELPDSAAWEAITGQLDGPDQIKQAPLNEPVAEAIPIEEIESPLSAGADQPGPTDAAQPAQPAEPTFVEDEEDEVEPLQEEPDSERPDEQ